MKEIYKEGKLVYEVPSLDDTRDYCLSEIDSLWEEYKRFDKPQIYKVDLSEDLWSLKK